VSLEHGSMSGSWWSTQPLCCSLVMIKAFSVSHRGRNNTNRSLLIILGGILTLKDFENRFHLHGNETSKGVIVGSYDLGCLWGALATGPIGGRIGRKRSILLGTTVMMIGAFLQFLAPNFGVMTAGRSDTYSITSSQ